MAIWTLKILQTDNSKHPITKYKKYKINNLLKKTFM